MNNSHIGKTCPYCQFPIKQDSDIMVCPACKIPHHSDCWQSNDGCTTFACTGEADHQDDDLGIRLQDNFEEKEWLVMRAGAIKGPYTRGELLASKFLEPADKLWNNFNQQWVNVEDLTDSGLRSNETNESHSVLGTKRPVTNQQNKKYEIGIAAVIISSISALGSYVVLNILNLTSILQLTIFIILGFLALGLGIFGLIQKEQDKVLAAIGSVFSIILILVLTLQMGSQITPPVYALEIPEIVSGPSSGVVETEYRFSASRINGSTGCNVEYCFDWDDGSVSEWNISNIGVKTWANAGNYQVQVKARCAENYNIESSWSAPTSLTIESLPIEVPLTPEQTSPANYTTVEGTSIIFHWQPVDNADSYKLFVIQISDGTPIIDHEVGNTNSYTINDFPDNGNEYQWSVSAGNSTGWSSWATYWSFTNGIILAPKPEENRESEDILVDVEWPPKPSNPSGGSTQPPQSSCSQQQSEQIARQHVLNGLSSKRIYSFDLVNVIKLSEATSWLFSYLVEFGGSSDGIGTMEITGYYIDVTVSNCQVVKEDIYESDWSDLF